MIVTLRLMGLLVLFKVVAIKLSFQEPNPTLNEDFLYNNIYKNLVKKQFWVNFPFIVIFLSSFYVAVEEEHN